MPNSLAESCGSLLLFAAASLSAGAALAQITDNQQIFAPVPAKVRAQVVTTPPPEDALVLFEGGNLDAWQTVNSGAPASWLLLNDSMTVDRARGASTSIETKRRFGDMQLHIEWATNPILDGDGQARGNSGIFLHSQFELQVLDSWQNPTYVNGQAGAIYLQTPPSVNASLPPGQWQSYDISFEAPRFDADGSLATPAFVTVFHNGVLIHSRTQIVGATYTDKPDYAARCTPYAYDREVDCTGTMPLLLQDHGQVVSYRNIWVREL